MSSTPTLASLRARKRALAEIGDGESTDPAPRLSRLCVSGRDKAMADVMRVAASLVQFASRPVAVRSTENKEITRKRVEDDTEFLHSSS